MEHDFGDEKQDPNSFGVNKLKWQIILSIKLQKLEIHDKIIPVCKLDIIQLSLFLCMLRSKEKCSHFWISLSNDQLDDLELSIEERE